MYKVITYKDRSGCDEIADYINELNRKINTNKDARIKYTKILRYIDQAERNRKDFLERYGE